MDQRSGAVTALQFTDTVGYAAVGPRLYALQKSPSGQIIELGYSEIVGGPIEDVVVVGSFAYVAAGYAGLYQFDVSVPSAIQLVALLDTPGYARAVAHADETLFVADYGGGLQIVDVSGATLTAVGAYNPGLVTGVAVVSESTVVISMGFNGLQLLNRHDS